MPVSAYDNRVVVLCASENGIGARVRLYNLLASLCYISSKSLETRPRYVRFNIMQFRLKMPIHAHFLGGGLAHVSPK